METTQFSACQGGDLGAKLLGEQVAKAAVGTGITVSSTCRVPGTPGSHARS